MPAKIIQLSIQPQQESKQKKPRMKARKDGLFQKHFWYTDKSGERKQKVVYGVTQAEAQKNKTDFLADVKVGLRVDKASMTVSTWINEFLAGYKPTVKSHTYRNKEKDMEVIREEIGSLRLREVEPSHIKRIVNRRAGMAKSYIRKLWISVGQLFEAARKDHIIPYSPCVDIDLPLGTENPHRELEQWERDLIFTHWHGHRFGIIAMIMLFAGCRPGEAIALDDAAIDLDKEVISVDEAISFDINDPIVGDPKTKAGFRNIPIFPPLFSPLKEYMHGRSPGRLIGNVTGGDVSKSGFKNVWRSFVYYLERKINNGIWRCHAPKGYVWKELTFTAYDLRHTFCTMCYDAGVDIKTTAAWMGHGDETVTLKIYTHLSRIRKQASIASMASFLEKQYSKDKSAE